VSGVLDGYPGVVVEDVLLGDFIDYWLRGQDLNL
jgi:hypothetical protein